MPAPPAPARETPANEDAKWTEDSGDTRWYLFDISTEKIAGDPADIVKLFRCTPETPRKNDIPRQTLSEIRAKGLPPAPREESTIEADSIILCYRSERESKVLR